MSAEHPNFVQSPVTKRALEVRNQNLGEASEGAAPPKRSKRRLTLSEFQDVVINNNILNDKELCRYASKMKKKGGIT